MSVNDRSLAVSANEAFAELPQAIGPGVKCRTTTADLGARTHNLTMGWMMSENGSTLEPVPVSDGRDSTLWHHADFVRLWTGATISMFGSSLTTLAVQIVAVVSLKADAFEMGILAALVSAPSLLLGLPVGVVVDRHRRRPLLIGADIGRALLLVTVPAAAMAGRLSMWQLFAVAFAVGALTVVDNVAVQAFLPALVGRTRLLEGNGKLQASTTTAHITGLGVAGLLVQTITAPMVICVDALTYLVSATFLLGIRQREARPESTNLPVLSDVRAGFRAVLRNPILRAVAGCTATNNFASEVLYGLYILYGARELGIDAATLGLVYGIGRLGAPVGALASRWAAQRLGVGRAIAVGAFIGSLEVLPVVFATPKTGVALLVAAAVFGNFGWVLYTVNQVSLRQAITPARLQGRMNATMSFLAQGVLPVGGLAGGILAQTLGLHMAITLAAIGSLLSFLWILFSPIGTLRQVPAVGAE